MEIDLERIDALETIFPDEVQTLKCIISYETDSRLRVKIFDPAKERYEVQYITPILTVNVIKLLM